MKKPIRFTGKFRSGAGRARQVFESVHRKEWLRALLGSPLIGTFNVGLPKGPRHAIVTSEPSYTIQLGDVTWWLYLCDVTAGNVSKPAWIVRWSGSERRREGGYVEVASREALPASFQDSDLEVAVFPLWSTEEIQEWLKSLGDFKWFQNFPWCPGRMDGRLRADSQLVWRTIQSHASWELTRVLDIGCHTGYFAFEASKCGAIVTAVDPLNQALRTARTIAHHIEKQDVEFLSLDPGGVWDTILYLSVQHQPDPTYAQLEAKMDELRHRCRNLFVELIVPPLQGTMSIQSIDKIVGGKLLLEYKHNIRRTRRIYSVHGLV